MLRLPCLRSPLRRLLHRGVNNRDQVLEQLRVCSAEDQLLDLVDRNKAKLGVNHVCQAVGLLWRFQKEKPDILRTEKRIGNHPQFLTLRVLAENKITDMDDVTMVDMLYWFLRFGVEAHDTLIQQLVSEGWLRIDRFQMATLSKFAICLSDMSLHQSPLMGHITSIVDQNLSSIDDFRVLTTLMISVSSIVSPRLRDALFSKAQAFLEEESHTDFNSPRRLVQFMRNSKYVHQPLLNKCNKHIVRRIPSLDASNIAMLMGMYLSLHFINFDFRLAVKERLSELIESTTCPLTFSKLFVSLAPMADEDTQERLEKAALLLVDEFSPQHAVNVIYALEDIQSRNLSLLNKIVSIIQRNLDSYKPLELVRITQSLTLLHYQNPELFTKLRNVLIAAMQRTIYPTEVAMVTRVLSMLPCERLDECVISRVDDVATQCDLNGLNTISFAITKWVRHDPFYNLNNPSRYAHLLQTINSCGQEKLGTAEKLDSLLYELKYLSGEWFEEMLMEETIMALTRMIDQVDWNTAPDLGILLTRLNQRCPPLLDRIASVAIRNIDKIHFNSLYGILLPFSILDYQNEETDKLYDICIKHVTPHLSSIEPHLLVYIAYCLCVADYFPEEMIREIFKIDFLGKLDDHLEFLPKSLRLRSRGRLMGLNRAVCLDSPEYQVPWFHAAYCQQLLKRAGISASPAQQQIHKMLGEVLGGMSYVRTGVVTPYYYTIDFECILDKNMRPLPYSDAWGTGSVENTRDELPPGAQRIAVDFLHPKAFSNNNQNLKGDVLLRKRHLEILGYRVVQIPHFVWNSMELSTNDAWTEYLKEKIFKDLSS